MEERLQIYETFMNTQLNDHIEGFRFRSNQSNSTIYPLPEKPTGPLGVNCSTPDCNDENVSFYTGVIKKLAANNGVDGPQGEKGLTGDIGPKVDKI